MGYSKQTTFPFVSCTGRRLTEDRANVRPSGADARPAVAAGTQQAVRGQNVPVHGMCGVHYGLRDCAIHEALSCPLLAQSGHRLVHCTCPLLG